VGFRRGGQRKHDGERHHGVPNELHWSACLKIDPLKTMQTPPVRSGDLQTVSHGAAAVIARGRTL